MTTAAAAPRQVGGRPWAGRLRGGWLLLAPAGVLFTLLLLVPLVLVVLTAFNPPATGVVDLQAEVSLENFARLATEGIYRKALYNSILIGTVTAVIAVFLGYPVAYVMANTYNVRRLTLMTILLLIPFQVDIIVRVFGLIVLLGNKGLINTTLQSLGLVSGPAPLMYNRLGVLIGTSQFMIPFVVFALLGALKTIDPELLQAGRSLGASYWRAFRKVILPLSVPGITAAALVAFTLTISNFTIPVVMSAYREVVLSHLLFQQVTVVANLQFAAAMAVTLLLVSLITVYVGYRVIRWILAAGGV